MAQKRQGPKSIGRVQARQLESGFKPAFKALAAHVFTVNPKTPSQHFHGHKIPCGEFTDNYGHKFQLQLHAVRVKSKFIKDNEIKPIFNKWSILFKLRIFVSTFINELFK